MTRIFTILGFLFCFFLLTEAIAENVTGRVVGVHDGDTVTILTENKESIKIRLDEIDAPELKQPYGIQAKKVLSDKIFEREITVNWEKRDRYKRVLGQIYLGEENINAYMVEAGFAWVYREYSNNASLIQLEEEAKEAQRGLWQLQDDQVAPPWEWRKNKRK